MIKNTVKFCWILFFLLIGISNLFAYELQNSAHQISAGGIVLSIYSVNSIKNVSFVSEQNNTITVGTHTYISKSGTNFDSELSVGEAAIKAVINPFDGLYYWAKYSYGTRNVELEIPSLTGSNKFSGSSARNISLGFRKLLFPDTLVSPALSLDLGVGFSKAKFDRVQTSDGLLLAVDSVLSNFEYQLAIMGSKKIRKVEPYGGVKIVRNCSELNDLKNLLKVSGYKDNVGITAGLKFNFYDKESVVLEAGFLGDRYISVGFNFTF